MKWTEEQLRAEIERLEELARWHRWVGDGCAEGAYQQRAETHRYELLRMEALRKAAA